MSTITAPTYDPISTATALAQKYNLGAQTALDKQTKAAKAIATALGNLGSAIGSFQTALSTLTGANSTLLSQSAAFSDTAFGSASASGRAVPGAYDFFVEQVATAGQAKYSNLADSTGNTGKLRVTLGTGGFDVDLAAAAGGDTTLTLRELAAAINSASGNGGQVAASVVTFGTNSQLVLTSTKTGANSAISLDLSAMGNGSLKTALQDPANASANTPQDAIAWIGGKSGTKVQQASNTFTNVDGLSVTFTKAQAATDPNLTVTVKSDIGATTANVQKFIDAYNKLKTTIDGLVAPANGNTGAAAGLLSDDAGVKALQARLVSLLRPASGLTLASFGITSQRNGTLVLDAERLGKQLAASPTGLDQLLGSTAAGGASGVVTVLNTYLGQWSGSTGQIAQRTAANGKLQAALTLRQSELDARYDTAYDRYLKQFTALQTLQSTMNNNVSLFDALFGNKDKS